MKYIRNRASLYMAAVALAGLPLLAAPNQAAAQDAAISPTNFNPPPCDYSDTFYEDNGVIPGQVVGRFGNRPQNGTAGDRGPSRGSGSISARRERCHNSRRRQAEPGSCVCGNTHRGNNFVVGRLQQGLVS
jgi:hypothetical protein